MGYLAVWKVLEEIIAEFRKRRLTVPVDVMNDLKYAKTMIRILKADPTRGETIQKIEEYLGNVEAYLISEGQKIFGVEYVEKWLKQIDEASRKILNEDEKETKFVPAVPREEKWIRIKPSKELPVEKLKTIAKELGLSYDMQKDDYLLIYGRDEKIKEFVKKIAAKHGLKAK